MRLTLVALACCLLPACSGNRLPEPLDRSWASGSVTVTPTRKGAGRAVEVRGEWPGASPDLRISYTLCLIQSGARDVVLVSAPGGQPLDGFRLTGAGVSDYSATLAERIDPSRPYRVVFDYEIWKGQPGKGTLLAKNSTFSAEVREPAP